MQIIAATIVCGTAQPGLEVDFRGEGGENVSIHLKGEEVSSRSDEEVIARAKEMLAQVIALDGSEKRASIVDQQQSSVSERALKEPCSMTRV